MKPHFEHADHLKIRDEKAKLKREASMVPSDWNVDTGSRIHRVLNGDISFIFDGVLTRLRTGDLTQSVRANVRKMAGVYGKKPKLVESDLDVVEEEVELSLSEIRVALWKIWELGVTEGFGRHLALIYETVIKYSRTKKRFTDSAFSLWETEDEAVRNLFEQLRAAIKAGYTVQNVASWMTFAWNGTSFEEVAQ